MRRVLLSACCSLLLTVTCAHGQTPVPIQLAASPFKRTNLRIAAQGAGAEGLQAMLLLPHSEGKHPLVMMLTNQGRKVGPQAMMPEADWFASRGFAVAVVSGRGSGTSGGKPVFSKCNESAPPVSERADAADLRATIEVLVQDPAIDAKRVLAVGDGRGGMGAAWLAEDPPTGFMGAISVDLGFNDGFGCRKVWDGTFSELGRTVRKPVLWMAIKGSNYKSTQHLFEQFSSAGGQGQLVSMEKAKRLEEDIFGGAPAGWTNAVVPFLTSLGLPADILEPVPAPLKYQLPASLIRLPAPLDQEVRDGFQAFLLARPSKAFALSADGHWGWATSAISRKVAEQHAIDSCRSRACAVVVSEE